MSDIQNQKKALRQLVKERKAAFSEYQLKSFSSVIFEKVELKSSFQYASTILCYWSIEGEVFTHDFINKWYLRKNILLPVIEGSTLVLKKFNGEKRMVINNPYKIPEPDGPAYTDLDKIDIAIIPGIAFDMENNRLGRGKAFYDKLLTHLSAIRIGVCFQFQLFENIAVNEKDIKMDLVIYD